MLKRFVAVALTAMLLLCGAGWAWAEDGDFGFDFTGDGYDGEWVSVEALNIEFCLPDGWQPSQADNGTAYAAAKRDGSATLAIRAEAHDVADLAEWGRANLKDYTVDETNFYQVLVSETEQSLVVRLLTSENVLLAFEFARADAAALSEDFALEIVGTVCELWDEDEVPFIDGGDDGDFNFDEDFGAALS